MLLTGKNVNDSMKFGWSISVTVTGDSPAIGTERQQTFSAPYQSGIVSIGIPFDWIWPTPHTRIQQIKFEGLPTESSNPGKRVGAMTLQKSKKRKIAQHKKFVPYVQASDASTL